MFKKSMLIVVAALALVTAPSSAAAEETRPAAAAPAAMTSERGYGYVFTDDPLAAGQMGSNTAIIKVRKRGSHATLIRPRVQFVTELLKSADSL